MARLKKVLLNLILLLFSLSFALLVGEGLVRVILPQDAYMVRGYQKPHAELGNVSRPNFEYYDTKSQPQFDFSYLVKTNNLGLRMNEDADDSTPSVLYMGDSFTFGWGVDIVDSYYSILSNATTTAKQGADSYQSLNCGHGSYSTGHVTKRLELLSSQVKVSKVIYFMNFNDLFDNINTDINYRTHTYSRNGEGEITLRKELVYSEMKRNLLLNTPYPWLNVNSHLFVLLKSYLKKSVNESQHELKPKPELSKPAIDVGRNKLITDVTLAHITELVRSSESLNIPLLIVWIPAPEDVGVKNLLGVSREISFPQFKQALTARLEGLNADVTFYDPTQLIRTQLDELNKKEQSIYWKDGHFNELGNRVFAAACDDEVQEFIYR